MNALRSVLLTLAGLFVDDASLAITIVLILVATAFVASTPWIAGAWLGVVLVAALIAALLENVTRSARSAGDRG
jgi:hypothetical protein